MRASCPTTIELRVRPQRRPVPRAPQDRRYFETIGFIQTGMPKDSFNREIDYLRISVIDNCNLRCVYCMPLEGLRFAPKPELLSAAEIEMVVRAAVSVGFRKFRLTGGEPTIRSDLLEIIARTSAVPGVGELAMTTNALLLGKLAAP